MEESLGSIMQGMQKLLLTAGAVNTSQEDVNASCLNVLKITKESRQTFESKGKDDLYQIVQKAVVDFVRAASQRERERFEKLFGQVVEVANNVLNDPALEEEHRAKLASRIPVLIVTGFLGSGKTTLLNYVLSENHGYRVAVIENEFGEVGIDEDLVADKFQGKEEIFQTNNGCICCTVRGDLIKFLTKLAIEQANKFDYVIIETTGLADPGPIAQTFFVQQEVADKFRIDAIVTVVDAKHIIQHLDEKKEHHCENEAIEQIAFADKILLNKIDLVNDAEKSEVKKRIKDINATGEIIETSRSHVPLDKILNVRAFDLDKILDLNEEFLAESDHHHDSDTFSVGLTHDQDMDMNKLNDWVSVLLKEKGPDIYRMKGIISVKEMDKKFVFQGVHMLFDGQPQAAWPENQKRITKLVFIGKNLNRKELHDSFIACTAE